MANNNKIFGYIRVSSKEQNEERQIVNMKAQGIDERDLFVDKQSGKDFDRPNYQLLKKMARKGDTIVFDSITRMGRNMNDTCKEYEWFSENGINLIFIKEPLINSNNEQDELMQKAMKKMILTLLTAFAEKERNEIKMRQAEGIAVAKAQGKHLGRPKENSITDEFVAVYDRWKKGELTAVQSFKELKLSKTTFYQLVKEHEGRE